MPISTEMEINYLETGKVVLCLTCEMPAGGKRYMNAVQGVLAKATTDIVVLAMDEMRESESGIQTLDEMDAEVMSH